MKKELLIAGFLASILILVPFSSISGAYIIGMNTTNEDTAEAYPIIPNYLLEDLYNIINQIFNRYGYDSEIGLLCHEIVDIIEGPYDSEFCNNLLDVFLVLADLWEQSWRENPFAPGIWVFYALLCGAIGSILFVYCGEPYTQSLGPNSLEYDSTKSEELILSIQMNSCPCMQ